MGNTPLIEKWVGKLKNPEATFNKIDADQGGKILFDEFADWAIQCGLCIGDDGNHEPFYTEEERSKYKLMGKRSIKARKRGSMVVKKS